MVVGSVDYVVVSNSTAPWFKCSHRQKFIMSICTVDCWNDDYKRKKSPGMAYFKKTSNLSNSAEVVIHRDSSSMSTLRSLWISYGLRDLVLKLFLNDWPDRPRKGKKQNNIYSTQFVPSNLTFHSDFWCRKHYDDMIVVVFWNRNGNLPLRYFARCCLNKSVVTQIMELCN